MGCFFPHCPSLPCLLVKISVTISFTHLMAFSLWVVGPRWMSGKAIYKLALPSALPHAYRETRTQTRLAHPQRSHMCTYEHMDRQTMKTPSGSQNQSSHTCLLLQTAHVLAFWHPHRHKDPHPDATATPTALSQLCLSSYMPCVNTGLSLIRISQVHLCLTNQTSLCAASWKRQLLNGSKWLRREEK